MTIFNARTPFTVSIDDYGITQIGSRITIAIYNIGTTPPVSGQTGFYTLSKSIVSVNQRQTFYNISNYVKEFIDIKTPNNVTYTVYDESSDNWKMVDVNLYWVSSTGDTLIQSSTYTATLGFSKYIDGGNAYFYYPLYVMSNQEGIRQVPKTTYGAGSYFNVISSFSSYGQYLDAVYTGKDSNGNAFTITLSVVNGGESRTIYNKCVPLSLYPFYDFPNITSITLKWYSGASVPFQYTIQSQIIEECKYTPVQCAFVNHYGGWEFLTFFKAQTNTISVKGTDYKFLKDSTYYNSQIGQFKSMNINGRQTVKLNTGWVDESYSDLIQDLLLSENVLLDGYSALVKTQNVEFKNTIKNKNINYEIEFEQAYNIINDVV